MLVGYETLIVIDSVNYTRNGKVLHITYNVIILNILSIISVFAIFYSFILDRLFNFSFYLLLVQRLEHKLI